MKHSFCIAALLAIVPVFAVHAQTPPPPSVTDSNTVNTSTSATLASSTKTEIITSGDLPEADASKLADGVLVVSQIKELLTGKQLTGWAQFQGNSNFDTYRFYSDGTAQFTTKGAFNTQRFKGTGRWVARKSGGYEQICWDIKGTWENRSCSSVMVTSGKVTIGGFFKQSDK
jgi:hypothetical protein